ncbi:4247_t:CDS:2 [Entrophospora sp. SA101]|nr:4247_t:CDS:2 [Entrophospora sp. SA101]
MTVFGLSCLVTPACLAISVGGQVIVCSPLEVKYEHFFAETLAQAGHNLQEELTQDLEKNTEGITLSTIHGVKGKSSA